MMPKKITLDRTNREMITPLDPSQGLPLRSEKVSSTNIIGIDYAKDSMKYGELNGPDPINTNPSPILS